MIRYRYSVSGEAARGQTWSVAGIIEREQAGMFGALPELVMRETFLKLTEGQAVFGHPGLGCIGPYRVTDFTIQEERKRATADT